MTNEEYKAGIATSNLAESIRMSEIARTDIDHVGVQAAEMQRLKNEASFRALRAGCALLAIKRRLEHGEFGPFCEKHFDGLTLRQLQNYMKIASAFCDSKGLEAYTAFTEMIAIDASTVVGIDATARKALPAGSADKKAVVENGVPQLVFDFIGGASLNELMRLCGIKQPSTGKPRKELPPAKPLTHADKVSTMTEAWLERFKDLNEHGLRQRTWSIVPHDTLKHVIRLLKDLARSMEEDVERQEKKALKRK